MQFGWQLKFDQGRHENSIDALQARGYSL